MSVIRRVSVYFSGLRTETLQGRSLGELKIEMEEFGKILSFPKVLEDEVGGKILMGGREFFFMLFFRC